jgi:VCBS repeat-containing protein
MAKTYKILVNDGKSTAAEAISVKQGVGDKGMPVRLLAKQGWRIELQDELKGKGLAPNQVRLKRLGKDLAIYFDNSQRADALIEDFYPETKSDNSPKLVGLAENGSRYEYVPQDPAISSMPGELKDGNTPVIVALGGGPIAESFALAGLPIVAAAGGISGWAVAGGVVAAAALGGGGGGGGAGGGPLPTTKGTGALATQSDTGYSNTDAITANSKPYYTGKTDPNKDVSITVDGRTYQGTAGPDGVYTIPITNSLKDGTYTPSVTVKDATTGLSTTADGSPFTVDTEGSPEANDSATVLISSISDDTGTTADFITSDNILSYTGRVKDFTTNGARVRLELKDSAGAVVKTEDVAYADTGAWTWTDTAKRDDGKYTLVARLVDAAGNIITTATSAEQVVLISANGPIVVNDTGTAQEDSTAVARGNVLSNDHTVDDSLISKKAVATTINGRYGTLTLQESGEYTYAVDNANDAVNALRGASGTRAADTLIDELTYTVTDATGKSQTAKLNITIEGANDKASVGGHDPSYVTMIDPDKEEKGFSGLIDNAEYTTEYGGKFKLSGPETPSIDKTDPNAFDGFVQHQRSTNSTSLDKTVHELFTVTSLDGTASHTFEVTTNSGSTHLYYGVTGNRDVLMLNTAGTTDLTGDTLHSVKK